MKKLFLTLFVALLSLGAQAQEKGHFAAGVHGGITTTKFEIADWDASESTTQLGAGLQANVGANWFVSGEYKWQPGIFGDTNVFMLGVGYNF